MSKDRIANYLRWADWTAASASAFALLNGRWVFLLVALPVQVVVSSVREGFHRQTGVEAERERLRGVMDDLQS